MSFKYALVFLIFIPLINVFAQDIECNNHNDYWVPNLNKPPKVIEIIINDFPLNVYYRSHEEGYQNEIYFEKVESGGDHDIISLISDFDDMAGFFRKLGMAFVQNRNIKYKWDDTDSNNKILTINIIKKVEWKIHEEINAIFRSTSIIPCDTDRCGIQDITIIQTHEETRLISKDHSKGSGKGTVHIPYALEILPDICYPVSFRCGSK